MKRNRRNGTECKRKDIEFRMIDINISIKQTEASAWCFHYAQNAAFISIKRDAINEISPPLPLYYYSYHIQN